MGYEYSGSSMSGIGDWLRRAFQPGYTAAEGIAALYRAHLAETGQQLTPAAAEYVKQRYQQAVSEGMPETQAAQDISQGRMPGRRLCLAESGVTLEQMTTDYNQAIFRVQRKLCDLGFDPGPVTGTITAQTRPTFDATVRRFQQDYGLEPTGTPDRVTLRAMGFAASEVDLLATALEQRGRLPLGPTPPGLGTVLPVVAVIAAGGALAFVAAKVFKR